MPEKRFIALMAAALAAASAALAQTPPERSGSADPLAYEPGPVTPMPKGAAHLAEDDLVGRTVITRSGVRLGPVEQVMGGSAVRVHEWWFSPDFGVLAIERFGGSDITIPLELLEPYGRDHLLLMVSRDDLEGKRGIFD